MEITLEPLYWGRVAPCEKLMFTCRSCSEQHEKYLPRPRAGLDGFAPLSVDPRHPHLLLAEGINPDDLAAITGESYELSFTDEETGTRKSFHVIPRIDAQEPTTARFVFV